MASHRTECGGDVGLEDYCDSICNCWCHRRCRATMWSGATCWRLIGHKWEHRSYEAVRSRDRYQVARNELARRRRRNAA